MRKCKTEHRWPLHYFPGRLTVVNEDTGEEKEYCLFLTKGELTVELGETRPPANKGTESVSPSAAPGENG